MSLRVFCRKRIPNNSGASMRYSRPMPWAFIWLLRANGLMKDVSKTDVVKYTSLLEYSESPAIRFLRVYVFC